MPDAPLSSISATPNAPHWPSWIAHEPSLVAEALAGVPDPLAAWLGPGPAAAPEAVAAALARALLPPIAADDPPGWLRPDQQLSFRRALATARRHGGALLADGVGTGKTWIGFAVAQALEPGRPVHVLVPAALAPQWREVARRIGLGVLLHSHETLSRGRLPSSSPGPVVIDESHRFRTPSTRRYQALAPWCVGRRGVLLSATPAVNRLEDVAQQLLLLVRDDALASSGVASLLDSARGSSGAGGALGQLVITGEDRSARLPVRSEHDIAPVEPPGAPFESLRAGVAGLRLASNPAIAALLRAGFFLALASSPAALAEALARYRALLLHAGDAAAAGRALSRQAIRRMIGRETEQLVFWALVESPDAAPDLAQGDLDAVVRLERIARAWSAAPDAKVAALANAITDRRPTLVFSTATATVRHIRRHLQRTGVAWCTGAAAGLDRTPLPREVVLDWFRHPRLALDGRISRPTVLVATDVAAEGLDLPLVERVVHYDLPWTQVRVEQRSGRAVRLGARHERVEVIRFHPPAELEEAIRKGAVLETKARLPVELGLDQGQNAPWRLRARIAERWEGRNPIEGVAAVPGVPPGVVAGFRIGATGAPAREVVLARIGGRWTNDPAVMARLLSAAEGRWQPRAPDPRMLRSLLRGIAAQVRSALRLGEGANIARSARNPRVRRALRRLLALASRAAKSRDRRRLVLLEQGIRFLRRGHSAGESERAASWTDLPEPELFQEILELPPEHPVPGAERAELIGVLVVERGAPPR